MCIKCLHTTQTPLPREISYIVDIVWDQYLENSIKSQVREKRGKGIRRRVKASTTLPRNWQQVLRVADKKRELCAFFTKYIAQVQTTSEIVSTDGCLVVCVPPRNTTNLAPYNHEEADTRMMLHLSNAVNRGSQRVLPRTANTDVVVSAIAVMFQIGVKQLWVGFGTATHLKFIPAHEKCSITWTKQVQSPADVPCIYRV